MSPTRWRYAAVGLSPQPLGHHLDDLAERPDGRLGDSLYQALGHAEQADRQGHSLLVVENQRRQGCTGGQLIAAVDTALCIDRIARSRSRSISRRSVRRDTPSRSARSVPAQYRRAWRRDRSRSIRELVFAIPQVWRTLRTETGTLRPRVRHDT